MIFFDKIMSLKGDEGVRHRRHPFSSVSNMPALTDRFLQSPEKIDTVSDFSDETISPRTKEKNNNATHLLEVQ